MPILHAQSLNKHFGGLAAVRDCSVILQRGVVTGLIGPNGAGKSTLLNLLSGHLTSDSGRIVFDGIDVTGVAPHRLAHLGMVRTFQISRELGALTVFENLLVAAPGHPGEVLWNLLLRPAAVRRAEGAAREQACAWLKRVGLWRLADSPANALSGGQKKLLEVVRALMLSPRLILLDEPAAGVAPPLVDDLCELIRELRTEGISFAIVEHDMDLIERLCDRVHVLSEGTPLIAGTFAEVIADTRVADAYLGGVMQ
ncbi:ABC transporter ATP-binding protein [Betaproteobacteria bacterium]|nr:ABC transporter ATP-binding protein [Betaproteobacteria bacterium]